MATGERPLIARAGQWRALGEVLGRGFRDDPVWNWVCPDPIRRQRHLGAAFAHVIRHRVLAGTAWTTPGLAGAAVWAPPGDWRARPVDTARMALPLLRAIGPRGVPQRVRALARIEARHPPEPHWYLEILATEPELRGRGVGSMLLEPMLERCDREGVPAYLESSKEANIAFYARFGFEVTSEIRIDDEAPLLWAMWRRPR
jgi:GNAT superfamily N-acetyltransferase